LVASRSPRWSRGSLATRAPPGLLDAGRRLRRGAPLPAWPLAPGFTLSSRRPRALDLPAAFGAASRSSSASAVPSSGRAGRAAAPRHPSASPGRAGAPCATLGPCRSPHLPLRPPGQGALPRRPGPRRLDGRAAPAASLCVPVWAGAHVCAG
jgi:hypothetical protein